MKQLPIKVERDEKLKSPEPITYKSVEIKPKNSDRFTKRMIDSNQPNFKLGPYDPRVDRSKFASVQVIEPKQVPKYDRDLGKHSFIKLEDTVAKDCMEYHKNRFNKYISSDPVNFKEG